MVAAKARDFYDARAKERQRAAIQERDEKGRAKSTSGQKSGSGSDRRKSEASEQAGAALNVSRRSVDRARVVQEKGVPELAKKVEAGEMSLSKAATWTPTACSDHLHHVDAAVVLCSRPGFLSIWALCAFLAIFG